MSHEKLSQLAMWSSWQDIVAQHRAKFCTHPVYVDQMQPVAEFEKLMDGIMANGCIDREGMTRDAEFGGRVVETRHGPVTRMWIDSNIEWDFLFRNLPMHVHQDGIRILDIGAGYGRFAVSVRPLVQRYVCVDAVPISTEICREYCANFNPDIEVPSLPDFLAIYKHHYRDVNVAVNIHSWNECKLEQIEAWLDIIGEIGIPYLFTVSHGQNDGSVEQSYYSWDVGRPSWRPLIEKRYTLLAEEARGFTNHPFGLWKRK